MAEYSRGQDNRENERSGHNNKNENNTRGRISDVNFDAINYEQRRKPYGSSGREENALYNNSGSAANGHPREGV